MMFKYTLTQREKELVDYHRSQNKLLEGQTKRQQTCEHIFRYVGHSHNDDAYECSKCGIIKYE